MPATATATHSRIATPAAPTASTPRQGDLLNILNNLACMSEADIRKAKKLLNLWYPMS
ncbi:hypothetical protein [Hymenobacter setariae]|uniref:hypothetical protein n=1 Tax=Hymenobacter setariae TaxID=2594794 RepID=UPI001F47A2B2|nr:hypothetical protein [Hymenobacter setariae]